MPRPFSAAERWLHRKGDSGSLGACPGRGEMRFAACQADEEIEPGSPPTWKSFLICRLLLKYPYQHEHLYLSRKTYQLCFTTGCLEHTLRLEPSADWIAKLPGVGIWSCAERRGCELSGEKRGARGAEPRHWEGGNCGRAGLV